MKQALIISSLQKSTDFFVDMVRSSSDFHITCVSTCGEARRLLLENEYALAIISSPLSDETGEDLAQQIAQSCCCQVLFLVPLEQYDTMRHMASNNRIRFLPKPIQRSLFLSSLKHALHSCLSTTSSTKQHKLLAEQIEVIRLTNYAKSLLVSYQGMSEPQAHRYLEKKSMDTRQSKRIIAEEIIAAYHGNFP